MLLVRASFLILACAALSLLLFLEWLHYDEYFCPDSCLDKIQLTSTLHRKDDVKDLLFKQPLRKPIQLNRRKTEYANLALERIQKLKDYSSHFCFGGEVFNDEKKTIEIDWFLRRCLFRNVGLDQKGKIVYHVPPEKRATLEFAKISFSRFFPATLAISKDPISKANYETRHFGKQNSEDKCLIFADDSDRTFLVGHDFDAIWSTFNAMAATQILSLENEVILVRRKSRREAEGKVWFTLARRVKLFESFLKEHPDNLLPLILLANKQRSLITFPTFTNSFLPKLYRDRALAVLNISVPIRNPQPIICLKGKNYRHTFLNHKTTLEHLSKQYNNSKVIEFWAYRRTNLAEEIKLMLSTDVFITPGGGGSFFSIFIREGGTVIYGKVKNSYLMLKLTKILKETLVGPVNQRKPRTRSMVYRS